MTHHHSDRQHPASEEQREKIPYQFLDHNQKEGQAPKNQDGGGLVQKKERRRGSQGGTCRIRTREVRGDGVGEVGVPDVAVALPQLHLLQHRLRLRPRHLAAARICCAAGDRKTGESSGSARTPRDDDGLLLWAALMA